MDTPYPDAFELDPAVVRVTGRSLGTGSYGRVKQVEVGGRVCAGKIVHDLLLDEGNDGVENMRRKYMKECKLVAEMRHPNIVQFLGVCSIPAESPLPVLVMELMDTNLHDFLENTRPIPLIAKRHILEEIAKGLVYLHERDPPIIHRDLTAMNVLISNTFDDDSSDVLMVASLTVKISDLGNSRIIDYRGTLTCAPGNILYMSPEANQSCYGPSLDVFSFGHCTLFVATQVFPSILKSPNHPGDCEQLLARSEVERREEYFTQMERLLPGGLQHPLAVLTRDCLSNTPENRPTAQELVSRLREMTTTVLTFQQVQQLYQELATKGSQILQLQQQLAAKESQVQELQQDAAVCKQQPASTNTQSDEQDSSGDEFESLSKQIQDLFREWTPDRKQWYKTFNSLHVLVFGPSGAGKSTLINAMIGEDVATIAQEHGPTTSTVSSYTQAVVGATLIFFDTPGFPSGRFKNESTVRDIRDTCKSVNVLLYCVRMDDQFRANDRTAIHEATRVFGKDIWRRTVFVLTRANQVEPSSLSHGAPNKYFDRIYSDMKHKIQTFTCKETGHMVPVVAAGCPGTYDLPICDNWRPKLMLKSFDIMYQNKSSYSLQSVWWYKLFGQ